MPSLPRDPVLFDQLVRLLPHAALIVSRQTGQVVDANLAVTALLGTSDVVGRDLADVLSGFAGDAINRGPATFTVRPAAGSQILEAAVSPLPLTPGEPAFALVQLRPAAPDSVALGDLRESRVRYEAVVSALDEGIVIHDRDGAIVASNESARRILGLTEDELTGRTSVDPRWQAVREDDSPFPGAEHPAMVTLRTGEPQSGVIMGVHRPRAPFAWISINSRPLVRPGETAPYAVVASFTDVTRQRQAEEERARLIRAEAAREEAEAARQRTIGILESINDAFFTLDRAWRFEYVNHQAEVLLGRRRDELLGNVVWDAFPEAVGSTFEREYARAMAEQVPTTFEAFYPPLNRWFEVHANPTPDLLSVYFRDATQRRRSEQGLQYLLRASRELAASLDYETTLERVVKLVVPDLADWCFVDVLEEGGLLRRIGVAHGRPEQAPLAQRLRRVFSTSSEAQYGPARVVRSGGPQIVADVTDETLRGAALDDENLAVLRAIEPRSILSVPLQTHHRLLGSLTFIAAESGRRYTPEDLPLAEELAGRCALAIENARLYREAQAAVQARQTERDHLTQTIEVLPNGVALADTSGRIVLSNAMAQAIWGQAPPATDLAGHQAAFGIRRLDGSEWPTRELPLARSLASGEVVQSEQMLVRNAATGEDIPLLVSSAPLRDEQGQIVGSVAAFQDISPIKEIERQKDEFLAAVSHDLQNPIASIKVQAQLLQRRARRLPQSEVERIAAGLERIDQTASKMGALIDELLDLARLEPGQPRPLDRREADLVDLVRRVAAEQQETSERHRIVVDSRVSPVVGAWDVLRIERVLANLLGNALKYSPDGGEIVVDVRSTIDWAVVEVRDHGVGIPPQDLPFIFTRFHRARNVRGQIRGTGIGLAAAQQIVQQHGGRIEVASELGQGSTFTIHLPLHPTP